MSRSNVEHLQKTYILQHKTEKIIDYLLDAQNKLNIERKLMSNYF